MTPDKLPSLEEIADLTPNMRKALMYCVENGAIDPKLTYWITLQGMCGRGLVLDPFSPSRRVPYKLTPLGKSYRKALLIAISK